MPTTQSTSAAARSLGTATLCCAAVSLFLYGMRVLFSHNYDSTALLWVTECTLQRCQKSFNIKSMVTEQGASHVKQHEVDDRCWEHMLHYDDEHDHRRQIFKQRASASMLVAMPKLPMATHTRCSANRHTALLPQGDGLRLPLNDHMEVAFFPSEAKL